MESSIKINKLEIENVKRIKAVKIEPTKTGLTIVLCVCLLLHLLNFSLTSSIFLRLLF